MEVHKILLDLIEKIENNVKNNKYNSNQLEKLAIASPKILDSCGKATMPFINGVREKNAGLEMAWADMSNQIVAKFKKEGIKNLDSKAINSIICFSLSALRTTLKENLYFVDDKFLKYGTDEEKREFINRSKYLKEAVAIFFEVVEGIDKKKVRIFEKIKNFFKIASKK